MKKAAFLFVFSVVLISSVVWANASPQIMSDNQVNSYVGGGCACDGFDYPLCPGAVCFYSVEKCHYVTESTKQCSESAGALYCKTWPLTICGSRYADTCSAN